MASVKMGVISRAIAFGPYGNLVAVGVGGRARGGGCVGRGVA